MVGAQVSVVGISKRFGATQALDAVSVEIEAGTIHALVGENGAGKSTLGKIIGGVYVADSGVLRVDGHDVGRWNPPAALAAGIATIQQELSLVPARSVAENVFLGIERSTFGVLRGSVLDRYRELDERVGFGLPGDVPVSSLRLADQQKVEIMRALARNARLIVLDEPTSSLSRDESQRLQQLIRDLRSHGRTLVYVSHFLDEVLAVADTVTIMRDGRITRTAPAAAETKDSLGARHARPPARGQLPGRPAGRRRRPRRARSASAVRAGPQGCRPRGARRRDRRPRRPRRQRAHRAGAHDRRGRPDHVGRAAARRGRPPAACARTGRSAAVS